MAAATPAGWYEDPTGRFEHRYWDGTSWSDNVSRAGTQFQDPIADDPTFEPSVASTERQPVERGVPVAASAPTATVPAATGRTCPHCLAQTTAGGDTCPSCGKKFKSAAKWPWVLVALCALMVIGFFGCVALVGTAADRAITTADPRCARSRPSKPATPSPVPSSTPSISARAETRYFSNSASRPRTPRTSPPASRLPAAAAATRRASPITKSAQRSGTRSSSASSTTRWYRRTPTDPRASPTAPRGGRDDRTPPEPPDGRG